MTWDSMTAEAASQWAERLWTLVLIVWLVLWFGVKRTKMRETPWERLQHALPVMFGFWLLFARNLRWLSEKFPQGSVAVWWIGLALTAIGVGISIWARLTLGSNWSGVVTLKQGHELIRSGLYRWIRHPIYTGILLGTIGTAIIEGHLRGWVGFAVFVATFYRKARREESFLQQEFGVGFEEHVRSTGMFLPRWT